MSANDIISYFSFTRLLASVVLLTITSSTPVASEECTVSTFQGTVRGETIWFTYEGHPRINQTMDVFKGIPYAEPPVGPNRFRKPVTKVKWDGVLNATSFRAICWQVPDFDLVPPQSEDCLYLNIWSPSVKRRNIPVMVWIHGGAFALGSTRSKIYDGRPLTAYNDVVVVSIQYRLNGFGFLTTGDDVMRGNYGLWDQNLALSWIKQNIAEFGGDPEKITLFGQSAGGASVGFHLLQPLSWNYFHNAIMMSGSMLTPSAIQLDTSIAVETAYQIGRLVGCDLAFKSEELAECLRTVDEYELILAMDKVLFKLEPTVDGEFITAPPQTLVRDGLFKQVSILLGSALNDGALATVMAYPDQIFKLKPSSDRLDFREHLQGVYSFVNQLILDAIEQQYIDWSHADDPAANYFYTFMDIETDETFLCTQETVSRKYEENGNDVYRYLFTHKPSASAWPPFPVWKGVAHGDDVPFVFGSVFIPEFADVDVPQEEIDLSIKMMTYYTNFAKTGNPNFGDDESKNGTESVWLKYTIPTQTFKELTPGLPDIRAYRSSYCAFWNQVIPDLISYKDGLSKTEKPWREEFIDWKYKAMKKWRESFFAYEQVKKYNRTC